MQSAEIRRYLDIAGTVGTVAHIDYEAYVTAIERKSPRGPVEHPYMSVDGSLAMARRDHANQGKRLDFETVVDGESEASIRLHVRITSEVYGTVTAYAESRKDARGAEGDRPLEVAETSALGRGLRMLGYGVLPGSGLTSAEDMQRVQREHAAGNDSISAKQIEYLRATYARAYGIAGRAESFAGLETLSGDRFGTGVTNLTVAQGRTLSDELRVAIAEAAASTRQATPAPTTTPSPAPATAASGGGYLADNEARNRVRTYLESNRLCKDPESKIAEWFAAGLDREGVDEAIEALHEEKWRRRYYAGLHDLGLSADTAKELLQISTINDLYSTNVESVLSTLAEMVRKETTGQ